MTLQEAQETVDRWIKEYGVRYFSELTNMTVLTEEVGELAKIIADYAGKKVVFEIPDAVEASGYSKATKALLDGNKLKKLGWKPQYGIKEGIERTLDILKISKK